MEDWFNEGTVARDRRGCEDKVKHLIEREVRAGFVRLLRREEGRSFSGQERSGHTVATSRPRSHRFQVDATAPGNVAKFAAAEALGALAGEELSRAVAPAP